MIIFFNPYESGETTGTGRRIHFLSNALNRKNIDNTIIQKNNIEKIALLKVLNNLPILKRIFHFFYLYFLVLKGHLVVTEVITSPTWNKNLYLTIHDLKAFDAKAKRGKGKALLYTFFCKLSKNIIAVSNFTKNELIKNCHIKSSFISVIPNGITNERCDFISSIDSNAEKTYDFVYLSSLAKHKRHVQLINSLPDNSSLLIIGRDFGQLSSINETIRMNLSRGVSVTVLTNVDSDYKLISLLKSSAVGVFPSVYEGFGIPILEYYLCNLVIVSSDIEPFKELSEYIDTFHESDNEDSLRYALKDTFNLSIKRNKKADITPYLERDIIKKFLEVVS